MNHPVTSKEALLQAAKEIVVAEGIDHLSIRYLAQTCGIAVGSVYNYFPAKAGLLFGVMEDFWQQVFQPCLCEIECAVDPGFLTFLERFYGRLSVSLKEFETNLLQGVSGLTREEKMRGKEIEQFYFRQARRALLQALQRDPAISDDLWTADFSQEDFSAFVFDQMFLCLQAGKTDCRFLTEVCRRLLQR